MFRQNQAPGVFSHPPQRVVSLVPSLTESLFDLKLGDNLVGVTEYCVHPANKTQNLPRVGGTKRPSLQAILALEPDLVLANQEENSRETIESLAFHGVPTWLTFPKTLQDVILLLRGLAEMFGQPASLERVARLEQHLVQTSENFTRRPAWTYFCPIWYQEEMDGTQWWMTFNRETYASELLRVLGGVNLFADRERRYPLGADLWQDSKEPPGDRDTRYPRIGKMELGVTQPDLILLPDEPYPFNEADLTRLSILFPEMSAPRSGAVVHFDGSLLTWHGTRLGRALDLLPDLIFSTLNR
jgi:ABC-type Fe3+-hydroxamate transport system substrate-binding protein